MENNLVPEYRIQKTEIARDPRSFGRLIVDDTCIVGGGVSAGTVVGNEEMGYFWESWDFGSSDVIYDTYDEAKKGLIEYLWLLKDREEE